MTRRQKYESAGDSANGKTADEVFSTLNNLTVIGNSEIGGSAMTKKVRALFFLFGREELKG